MKTGLQHLVSGRVSMGEEAARVVWDAMWNRAPEKRPFAVAECRSEPDVQHAVRFAVDHGFGVSVLSGGNDSAARGALDGGVVLDVRPLSSVAYNSADSTVQLGGGARILDLIRGLPSDRVAATGDVSTVGVAALTLGGGYSKLLSRFGLALDNLKSVRVVLADGSVVTADERQEPELFWALRGGGGNFGAVTSLTLGVHEVPAVLSGMVFVPLRNARAGVLAAQCLLDDAPDSLSLSLAIGSSHSGERGLVLWPFWSGERAAGDRYFDEVAKLEGASVVARRWSSYADSFNLEAEKGWGKGRNYAVNARSLLRLDDEAADVFLECGASPASPIAWIIAHDFRGAASRVAPEATAFPLRRDHMNVNVIAGWEVGGDAAPHVDWVRRTTERLSALAVPGAYVNLLGPAERQRVRDFYGAAASRLLAVKARVDPGNLFSSNVGQL